MPTNRTRRTRGHIGSLSEARLHYLWWGCDLFDWDRAAWLDDNEIKAAWLQHRDQIMDDWLREKNNAGRRPWGYWFFDKGIETPETASREHPNQLELLREWDELSIEEKEMTCPLIDAK